MSISKSKVNFFHFERRMFSVKSNLVTNRNHATLYYKTSRNLLKFRVFFMEGKDIGRSPLRNFISILKIWVNVKYYKLTLLLFPSSFVGQFVYPGDGMW